jgi:predicted O-linked N-acetylglucosamine transferase (SPINDLY family)
MLQALDVPELITASLSDYRDAAVRLATAPNERAAIKAKLVAARAGGLQFDTARFVRQLEACFLEAHGIYTAGQNPRNITAPPS